MAEVNLEASPTYNEPAIPAPPVTVKAPVPTDVAVEGEENLDAPPTFKLPPMPTPPVTTTAPEPTPIEATDDSNSEALATYKLPPIPTPPVTFKAPVDELMDIVASVTDKAELNVLAPAKVCVPVETTPLALDPASGKLNVCVDVTDDTAKSVPDVPV